MFRRESDSERRNTDAREGEKSKEGYIGSREEGDTKKTERKKESTKETREERRIDKESEVERKGRVTALAFT
jgi:hypothetical protein